MTLQISVFGIFILAVVYASVFAGLALVTASLKTWKPRLTVIGAIAAVPVLMALGEEIWIAWKFTDLCKDAGVHVKHTVEVEGYLDDTSRSISSSAAKRGLITAPQTLTEFDKAGYRFRESMLRDGKVWRLERTSEGLLATIGDRSAARYKVTYTYNNAPIGHHLEKWEKAVVDSETSEILGRDTGFNRYPSTVEGFWIRLFSWGPTICRSPLDQSEQAKRSGSIEQYVLIARK